MMTHTPVDRGRSRNNRRRVTDSDGIPKALCHGKIFSSCQPFKILSSTPFVRTKPPQFSRMSASALAEIGLAPAQPVVAATTPTHAEKVVRVLVEFFELCCFALYSNVRLFSHCVLNSSRSPMLPTIFTRVSRSSSRRLSFSTFRKSMSRPN